MNAFLVSIAGGLAGGLLTFLGVLWTIRYYKRQDIKVEIREKEKKYSVAIFSC